MYVPWNAPVEAPGRTFAFGELENAVEAIVPNVEGERAGDGDGDRDGDVGGMDGTTSGVSVDSIRVNEALLAVGSQHTHQTRRLQNGNLPVLSVPPIHRMERPYGLVICRRRRGRIKFASTKVSQTHKVEMAYLKRVRGTQPCGNLLKRTYGVIGPKRRRGRMQIESIKVPIECLNDKMPQEDERTYRRCAQATQPLLNAPNHRYGVHRPICRHGRIKTEPRYVNQREMAETPTLNTSMRSGQLGDLKSI